VAQLLCYQLVNLGRGRRAGGGLQLLRVDGPAPTNDVEPGLAIEPDEVDPQQFGYLLLILGDGLIVDLEQSLDLGRVNLHEVNRDDGHGGLLLSVIGPHDCWRPPGCVTSGSRACRRANNTAS
jgi:hypothetical protein